MKGNINPLFSYWDVGISLCGSLTAPLSKSTMSVIRSVITCAEGKTWPSHWLGSLIDEVDVYARYHGDDGAQASHTRRHNGVDYTNERMVRLVIQQALKPLLHEPMTADKVLSIKVIDPAVGSANFLVEVVNQLALALFACGEEILFLVVVRY